MPLASALRKASAALSVEFEHPFAGYDTAAVCPFLVSRGELGDDLWVLCREIVALGAVGVDVVKLPRPAVFSYELPWTSSHACVAFVFPEQCALLGRLAAQ